LKNSGHSCATHGTTAYSLLASSPAAGVTRSGRWAGAKTSQVSASPRLTTGSRQPTGQIQQIRFRLRFRPKLATVSASLSVTAVELLVSFGLVSATAETQESGFGRPLLGDTTDVRRHKFWGGHVSQYPTAGDTMNEVESCSAAIVTVLKGMKQSSQIMLARSNW
jgi:hypothetical protein